LVTGKKFDLVMCNFALHYFNLSLFINTILQNAKKNAYVILTFFDGDKIVEHDNVNSKIIRRGNVIDVYIKDSVLNKPTTENILNLQEVIKAFNDHGFQLEKKTNFSEYYPLWNKKGNILSKEEQLFSFMNIELVFKSP
jgi:hypothetical protein